MKYFLRFLKNNPLYAVINMVGLALSLMFVILIGENLRAGHREQEHTHVMAGLLPFTQGQVPGGGRCLLRLYAKRKDKARGQSLWGSTRGQRRQHNARGLQFLQIL